MRKTLNASHMKVKLEHSSQIFIYSVKKNSVFWLKRSDDLSFLASLSVITTLVFRAQSQQFSAFSKSFEIRGKDDTLEKHLQK